MREADSLFIIVFVKEIKDCGAFSVGVVEGDVGFKAIFAVDSKFAVAENDSRISLVAVVDNVLNIFNVVVASYNTAAVGSFVAFKRDVDIGLIEGEINFIFAALAHV